MGVPLNYFPPQRKKSDDLVFNFGEVDFTGEEFGEKGIAELGKSCILIGVHFPYYGRYYLYKIIN